MINSLNKTKRKKEPILKESLTFVYSKIKSLIPALIVTFVVGAILVYGKNLLDIRIWLSNQLLPELFQLGILGYEMSVNSSWWYISAMLIVIAILYPLAKKYDESYCKYIEQCYNCI